jgi:glutathione S-transferase
LTHQVPVLKDGDLCVWDSLAICEYVNEKFALTGLPAGQAARAVCRSVCAEMHSGFINVRRELPMNCRRVFKKFHISSTAHPDIHRIFSLWEQCLKDYSGEGPFLFGGFSVADAMFAPVVFRFATYGVPAPSAATQQYMQTMLAHAPMQEWLALAQAEPEVLVAEEKEESP